MADNCIAERITANGRFTTIGYHYPESFLRGLVGRYIRRFGGRIYYDEEAYPVRAEFLDGSVLFVADVTDRTCPNHVIGVAGEKRSPFAPFCEAPKHQFTYRDILF